MSYLLDTHILLWAISGPGKLSMRQRRIIEDKKNQLFTSHFSLIEIAIKLRLGKLSHFRVSLLEFVQYVERIGVIQVPILLSHLSQYHDLPLLNEHRDPFDRFIISAAIAEKLKVLTSDSKFLLYKEYVEIG